MLLIEPDPDRRERLAAALRAAGFPVVAVGNLLEIAHWPADQAVVTVSPYFTPWWRFVGASQVVVLADNAKAGIDACDRGATAWTARDAHPDVLLSLLETLGIRAAACQPGAPSER